MRKSYIESSNQKLREGAYTVLDQLPGARTRGENLRLIGFAIDTRFWHYLVGPLLAVLFLKSYLIFEANDSLLLIRVRKQNNYKFRYMSHIFLRKHSCDVKRSKGFITDKLNIMTADGQSFKLKFSKTVRWNRPDYVAEILKT